MTKIGKSENEEGPRRATCSGPIKKGKTWPREGKAPFRRVAGHAGARNGGEGKAFTAPASHEVGRLRAARELDNPLVTREVEHDEFGLCTSRRMRASDKRRETGALRKYWRQVQVRCRTPARGMSRVSCRINSTTECTKGQPEPGEAERQRQKGQQAQQQRRRQVVRRRRRERCRRKDAVTS